MGVRRGREGVFQQADKFSEAPRKEKPLVRNQATSRRMDRCSLCGQPKTRLEFSWTLLWLATLNLS